MKEVFISIFTSQPFWTIISGVVVFALSQYLMEVWIKPLQDYKKIKYEVAKLLVFNAPYYSNVLQLKDADEARKLKYTSISEETRTLAAELRAYIELMPLVHPGIPSKKKLHNASAELIGLSNGLFKPYGISDNSSENANRENIENISRNLKLRK